ncbi:MAG: hypothetical protein LBU65_06875, partial [Planctomycetaceae bacterium]|nr:hypothetical protein [Planctomycetaceae bacterium]
MKNFVLSALCAVVFVAVVSYATADSPAPCVPVKPCPCESVAPCEAVVDPCCRPTLAERIAARRAELQARIAAARCCNPCCEVVVDPCVPANVAPCEAVVDPCCRPTLAERLAARRAARHCA